MLSEAPAAVSRVAHSWTGADLCGIVGQMPEHLGSFHIGFTSRFLHSFSRQRFDEVKDCSRHAPGARAVFLDRRVVLGALG